MPKPPKPYKIERAHMRGCHAVKRSRADGTSPFATLEQGIHAFEFCNRYANPHVRRGAWHYYVRFRCNDTQCHSTILVHAGTMLDRLFSQGARDGE